MTENKFSLEDILSEYPSDGESPDEAALDDILSSYPATKNYEDSGLAEIFDSRNPTNDISLSGINISLEHDYPSPEEIRNSRPKSVHDIPEDQLTEEERIKKDKQIKYEIMSGDYDRKYMPDELKTDAELRAEREEKEAAEKKTKKTKVKPVKKRFDVDITEGIKGLRDIYDEEEDDYDKKYGSSPLLTDTDLIPKREKREIPFEIEQPEGMSLSEKMERQDEYEEKYASAEPKREHNKVKPEKVTPKKAVRERDPFDKYADDNDLDSILSQYEKPERPKTLARSDTSHLKGFTDIFNKLLAKEESDGEGSELLEESKKIKHQNNPSAIERKKISDIDLDLSDKLIQDTAQISRSKADTELEKMSALKERRSKKIKDFVLVGDEEENTEAEVAEEKENEEIDDFKSLEDAPDIEKHI